MNTIAPDYERTDMGIIQIAPEVIEIIAGLATIEVDGVAGMSGGLGGGIAQLLGRKNLSKGIKVEIGEEDAVVDVSIIVKYGFPIPELAKEIQKNVKNEIYSMTGIEIQEIHVHIHDVQFQLSEKLEEDAPDLHRIK